MVCLFNLFGHQNLLSSVLPAQNLVPHLEIGLRRFAAHPQFRWRGFQNLISSWSSHTARVLLCAVPRLTVPRPRAKNRDNISGTVYHTWFWFTSSKVIFR